VNAATTADMNTATPMNTTTEPNTGFRGASQRRERQRSNGGTKHEM
jgi:hypothetical protein